MEWWMWLAGGLGLLVIELATPSGFFVMFFGLGALTVGLLARIGMVRSVAAEWLLFTISSVVYLLLFRRRLEARVQRPGASTVDSLVGDLAVAKERIPAGGVGKVELRGSTWNARNSTATPIEPGQRSRVTGVEGLVVFIRPE